MKRKLGLFVCLLAMSVGCTANERARSFGGTETINLPADKKLVNATWKNTDLWLLTRSMRAGETAESYQFKEKSSYGVLEGTVNINESKSGN